MYTDNHGNPTDEMPRYNRAGHSVERGISYPIQMGIWGGDGETPGWNYTGVSANAEIGHFQKCGPHQLGGGSGLQKLLAQKAPGEAAQLVAWHDIPQKGAYFSLVLNLYRVETTEEALNVPTRMVIATAASVEDLVAGNFAKQATPELQKGIYEDYPDEGGATWYTEGGYTLLEDIDFHYPDAMVFGVIVEVGPSNSGDGRLSYVAMEPIT